MQLENLIRMANQIATYFKTQPGIGQAEKVAEHINDFWEPSMRAKLAAHVKAGGEGLLPLTKDAFSFVRAPSD